MVVPIAMLTLQMFGQLISGGILLLADCTNVRFVVRVFSGFVNCKCFLAREPLAAQITRVRTFATVRAKMHREGVGGGELFP